MDEVERISTIDFEDSVNVQINHPSSSESKETPQKCEAKQEITSSSCPVEGVTVFLDRAEVRRLIKASLVVGENEVLVTGLPSCMDEDSIRVQCLGEAKILEVSHLSKKLYITELKDPNPEETKSETQILKETRIDTKNKIKKIQDRIQLLEKEKAFLNSYGERLGPVANVSDKLVESFDKKSLENVAAFIGFYHTQGKKLSDELFDDTNELNGLELKLKQIDERLEELESLWGSSSHAYYDKRVSILLEAQQETELPLVVSYVVTGASWSPLYDIRAFSKDNSLQLLYFGVIKQTTGEDWPDAKLSLSTALPSVGGAPPELETLHIHTIGKLHRRPKKRYGSKLERGSLVESGLVNDLEPCFGLMSDDQSNRSFALNQYIPTDVKEGITSATFSIPRKSTIKSDDTEHNVAICQIDLKPNFDYDSAPKLVAHAFLHAKVKNESNYALLEGPAKVFLDNNFLTKTHMDAVSPSEEFELSLGVDPAIKVTYKPLRKFMQRTGVVSKSTQTDYHQQISVKNTKTTTIKIKIRDQLPKSSEDKLKVILKEPAIPSLKQKGSAGEEQPVKLTDKNHIEWNLEIKPSETKELNMKYTVEHPADIAISGL
ncbi:protein F37C4.5-like isoform X2 [Rhopilema esculentum]|uniref:protein F37C4.5-like isoform X2 n=1 Tax=Rhopilema esculentum TaxID=499914 RepID=UPI0031D86986